MSKDLNQFYREMWTWVQDGCKGHPVFKTHYGLCHNLRRWEAGTNADLIRDQERCFFLQCGSVRVPFNNDVEEYLHEDKYQNPKRLAFIKEHAK